MDEINNTSGNTEQQLPETAETTSIMSSLTAVAPLSSQVVEDFQPDSKWEFTPLEKASLDCIDIETQSYEMVDNGQQTPNQDSKPELESDGDDSAPAQQQHTIAEESNSQDQVEEITTPETVGDEPLKTEPVKEDDQQPSTDVVVTSKEELDHGIVVSEEVVETVPSEVESIVADPDVAATHVADSTEEAADEKELDKTSDFKDTDTCHKTPDPKEDLPYRKDDLPSTNNSTTNFLSQTSVDAQMEKVIDNVVELGGGQNFGPVFGRSEDKAKVLESIHREITSDRSSMEIMADVALQQLEGKQVEADDVGKTELKNIQDEEVVKKGDAPMKEERQEDAEVVPIQEATVEPSRPTRNRVSKKFQDAILPKEYSTRKQTKRSRTTQDSEQNKSLEATKNTPMIKLPTQKSRATISVSNPSSRPTPPTQKRPRSPSPDEDESSIGKKYSCSECNFSTDRLNNLVFHYTKSYCPGKCQIGEVMKADIIKQQQTPKGNKNKRFAR